MIWLINLDHAPQRNHGIAMVCALKVPCLFNRFKSDTFQVEET